MGCGASAHPSPKDAEDGDLTVCESQTWATKTSSEHDGAVGSDARLFSTPKGFSGNSSLLESSSDRRMVVLDAEDEDTDEVEIIYETPSKQEAARHPSAANGQEPPDAAEFIRPEPEPLSKQQQEEAAKLAERRKRFDNQRYQREQRSAPADSLPLDVPTMFDSDGGYPGLSAAQKPPVATCKPTTDMMLGLNVSHFTSKESTDMAFLPGGIFDEDDDVKLAPQTKSRSQHDDVKSSGFDDDDEKLMKEILDNFDV